MDWWQPWMFFVLVPYLMMGLGVLLKVLDAMTAQDVRELNSFSFLLLVALAVGLWPSIVFYYFLRRF
jgi:hypothetical protein